ncbi:MAG TPA: ABC transporter permease [Acidimicrobiales bacterium]|nr:ABC transporter permease [Acidimicrobiales bacterium]
MNALTIAGVSLRRLSRDRTALFFIVALPIFVIIIIGASVRGFTTFPVGVVDLGAGQSGRDVVGAMQHAGDLAVHRYSSVESATKAVARAEVNVAVILPKDMDSSVRAGHAVEVEVLAEQTNSSQQAAVSAVRSVLAAHAARVQAALFASAQGVGDFDRNLARAASLQPRVPLVQVRPVQVDSRANTLPEGFSYSAPTMLVLFAFINTLAGAASIIETRRLGMYERMSTAPVRPAAIIAGEAVALVSICLLQAGLIVLIGAVAFGVSWGNPLAAVVLIGLWAVLSAGAGMLAGTLFHTPEQAGVIGPTVGMALGMLGGCMWPLSIVSGFMRSFGHIAPHAWAVDAWTALIARGGNIVTIAPQLAVLAGFAAVLMALATGRLRRTLV